MLLGINTFIFFPSISFASYPVNFFTLRLLAVIFPIDSLFIDTCTMNVSIEKAFFSISKSSISWKLFTDRFSVLLMRALSSFSPMITRFWRNSRRNHLWKMR